MDSSTRMTQQDLDDAKPIADKIVAMMTGLRGPTTMAGVALALAACAHMTECGPIAPRKLFGMFYRDLEEAQNIEPGAYERTELRKRLAGALGEQKMLSLMAFAAADLAERQRVLDTILDALGVL